MMKAFQDALRFQLHVAVILSDLHDLDKGLLTGSRICGFGVRSELQMGYC